MPTNKVKISLYMIISDPNSTVNPDKPLEVGSHCVTALILHNVNNQQYKHVVHYYTICINLRQTAHLAPQKLVVDIQNCQC